MGTLLTADLLAFLSQPPSPLPEAETEPCDRKKSPMAILWTRLAGTSCQHIHSSASSADPRANDSSDA